MSLPPLPTPNQRSSATHQNDYGFSKEQMQALQRDGFTPVAHILENKTMTLLQFTKHEVENADDWSEWVCPDPKSYMMKCCDCGLVHEAQFGVVQYAVGSNEDCEPVVAQNVQAVFRMRRSHPWTTEDMAHRPGGLTLEIPLPPSTLYDTRQCSNGHTNDSMREYGQECYEKALLDAMNATRAFGKTGAVIATAIGALK